MFISSSELFDKLKENQYNPNGYRGERSILRESFCVITDNFLLPVITELDRLNVENACLKAKLYAYEAIISNSNFAPVINNTLTSEAVINEDLKENTDE